MTGLGLDQVANTREKILFGVVVLVLLFLFVKVLSLPQMEKVQSEQAKLQTLLIEKQAMERFLEASPKLEKGETLSRRKNIKMKILYGEIEPAYQDITSLLSQLTEASFLGRMTVQKMSFEAAFQEKGYQRTDFTLNLLGDFTDIISYLERVEQFPALFNLEDISLLSETGQPQRLHVELKGRFFKTEEGGHS